MSQASNFESKITEALHYIDLGRFQQTLTALFNALSESPDNSEALYLAAYCYYNLDDNSKAEDFCLQSMENGYDFAGGNYLLGSIYMDEGSFGKAEKCLLRVLNSNPLHAEVLSTYGMLMLRTGILAKSYR